MSELSLISVCGGVYAAVVGSLLLLFPEAAREAARRFPRNRLAGIALSAIDVVWSALLVRDMPMGELERYKPMLWLVAPALFFLAVSIMRELLAARALGGLLMLIPAPVLDAARWHPSEWRVVMSFLAYVMAASGMALMLGPYYFRKTANAILGTNIGPKLTGGFALGLAALLIALGITAF